MSSAKEPIAVSLADTLRFVWRYYRQHKKMVVLAYLAMTICSSMSILTPYMYAWLVDTASGYMNSEQKSLSLIMMPVMGVVVVSITYHLFMRAAHFLNCYTDSRVQAAIAADSTARVHMFETEWHSNHFTGSMVTAIKRGRSSAHTLYDEICYNFWPAIFVGIGTIGLMLQKSWIIGCFFIFFAIAFTSFSIIVSRVYIMPYNRAYSDEDSRLGGTIADSLTGQAVVKSFSAETRENERLLTATNNWQRLASVAWVRINMLSLSQNILINIGRVSALFLGAVFWVNGTFTAGDLIYVLMAQRVLSDYLDGIGNDLNRVTTAINDMEEVVYWSSRTPKIQSKPGAKNVLIKEGSIGFHRVTFFYNEQNRPALTDFSLSIRPGEKIALVGPSGGGKSTVMKLLQRFYEAQQGTITIDDHDIMDMDLSSLRSSMALVPQDPILFHRTLADNIAYGKPNATMNEIRAAAEAAQISKLIANLPKGYDTLVGERGIKLSGGERQRVAIARAILANSPILLLDEATSALDSESEEYIQIAIAEASKHRTMIAIAHRLSTIQSADRIIVLSEGRIVEQGSHRELLAIQNGLYHRLYESQAKGFLPDHVFNG